MNRQDAKGAKLVKEPGSRLDELARQVVDAAYCVHRALGPGLLESAYETCMEIEFRRRSIPFNRQLALGIEYEGERIETAFRLDFLIEERLVLELKAVERLLPIHEAQLLTYLKLARLNLGLLINFNVPLVRDGIRRIVLT
jgi:GxxExxY protein